MKKSTGIVFIVVVLLGLWAYFREWRGKPGPEQDQDSSNNVTFAFKFDETQINQIKLTRGGMTVVFDRKEDGWYETSPVMMRADQSAVGEIAHSISELPSDRTLHPNAAQLAGYGLNNPSMIIQFRMMNGETHTMAIGGKDFSNLEVYSQLDGSKDVTLVANTVANAADKPFDEFRDHTVLFFSSQFDVSSLNLKNAAGGISAKREGENWEITKPVATAGDAGSFGTMLGEVSGGKLASFVSDDAKSVPPATLAQYGLNDPSLRLDLTLNGGKSTSLVIGKKNGALEYYAEDTGRGMIFSVPNQLVTALNRANLADLRAKVLYTGLDTDVTSVVAKGPGGGSVTCTRNSNGNMVVQQAAGSAAQAPDCPDFVGPLQHAEASKVEDDAPADVRARLAKPAIEVRLTYKDSSGEANPGNPVSVGTPASSAPPKTLEIQVSGVAGNSVYARTSAGPAVYRFDKNSLDALDDAFKTSSSAPSSASAAPAPTPAPGPASK